MLTEGAHILSLRDYHALRAHAGIAPVTKQSGKSRQVLMRYRCNQRLRNVFYHWARSSIQHHRRSNITTRGCARSATTTVAPYVVSLIACSLCS
jgi:transposase